MYSFKFLKHPTPHQLDQLIILYENEGWWSAQTDNRDLLEKIIAGSHCYCVAVYDNKIIGMGRSISDGASDAYIQDVAVLKSFRRKGIATRLVTTIIERLEKDGIGWIGLIAEKGSAGFYRPLGFVPMSDATPMLRLRKP